MPRSRARLASFLLSPPTAPPVRWPARRIIMIISFFMFIFLLLSCAPPTPPLSSDSFVCHIGYMAHYYIIGFLVFMLLLFACAAPTEASPLLRQLRLPDGLQDGRRQAGVQARRNNLEVSSRPAPLRPPSPNISLSAPTPSPSTFPCFTLRPLPSQALTHQIGSC
jgi:hypothetical protein